MEKILWKVLSDGAIIGGEKVSPERTVELTWAQAEYPLMQGHITKSDEPVVAETSAPVVEESTVTAEVNEEGVVAETPAEQKPSGRRR